MKVTIAILCPENIHGDTAICLADMTPKIQGEYSLMAVRTAIVADGRNKCLSEAKRNNSDYLMFIDSDIVFPSHALARMSSLEKDIVTGIYHQGGLQNFRPCIYRFTETGQIANYAVYQKDIPFKVDAAGAGMLLISRHVLTALPDNAFDHMNLPGVGQVYEDVSFFHRVRDLGFEVWADPTLRIGHTKTQTIYPEHFDAVISALKANIDKREGINGWMTESELDWLKRTAGKMSSIVEIGSHKGRSTKVLLDNCKGTVRCVDLWDGKLEMSNDGPREALFDGDEILNEFIQNVGMYGNLEWTRKDSVEAASGIPDKSVDMVFIDGDHSYEGCKRDIEAWLPKARKIICGHDYSNNWPGVIRAVDENIRDFFVHESIWYKEVS